MGVAGGGGGWLENLILKKILSPTWIWTFKVLSKLLMHYFQCAKPNQTLLWQHSDLADYLIKSDQ